MADKMTAGAGSGVGRMQKAAMAKHIHHPTNHPDGHNTGHKKIKRYMKAPSHNKEMK